MTTTITDPTAPKAATKPPLIPTLWMPKETWTQWLERWHNSNVPLSERLALLHRGFETEHDGSTRPWFQQVYEFYLRLASNSEYKSSYPGLIAPEVQIEHSDHQKIARIRKKALQMLCDRLKSMMGMMPGGHRDERLPTWCSFLADDLTAEAMLIFIREVAYGPHHIQHPMDIAKTFIRNVLDFAFESDMSWVNRLGCDAARAKKNMLAMRPALLHVAHGYGLLLHYVTLHSEAFLDDECLMEELKELVYKKESFMFFDRKGIEDDYRNPRNLEESLAKGSHAGTALALLQARKSYLKKAPKKKCK